MRERKNNFSFKIKLQTNVSKHMTKSTNKKETIKQQSEHEFASWEVHFTEKVVVLQIKHKWANNFYF